MSHARIEYVKSFVSKSDLSIIKSMLQNQMIVVVDKKSIDTLIKFIDAFFEDTKEDKDKTYYKTRVNIGMSTANNYKSILYKAIEQYLYLKECNSQKPNYHLTLARYFNKNNNPLFENILVELNEIDISILEQYYIYKELHTHTNKTKNRSANEKTILMLKTLDNYYYAEYLQLLCNTVSNASFIDTEGFVSVNNRKIKELKNTLSKSTIHYAYIYMYEAYLSFDKKKYDIALKYILEQDLEVLKKSNHFKSIYKLLLNLSLKYNNRFYEDKYCLDYINIFEKLYIDSIENHLQNNIMPIGLYKNIITFCCRHYKIEDAKQYLGLYKKYIHPDFVEDAYAFNSAQIHIACNKHNLAWEILRNVKINDLFYKGSLYILFLKIYYEEEEYSQMTETIKKLYEYITDTKKTQMCEEVKTKYLSFITILKGLLKNKVQDIPLDTIEYKWLNLIKIGA